MEIIFLITAGIIGVTALVNKEAGVDHPRPSVVSHWQHTKLTSNHLTSLISDQYCHKDAKSYLACASAMQEIGDELGIYIEVDGRFKVLFNSTILQKPKLSPWEVSFNKNKKISFVELWNKKILPKLSKKEVPAMVGIGINGFWTIAEDPHTYLEPKGVKFINKTQKIEVQETELTLEDEVEALDEEVKLDDEPIRDVELSLSSNPELPSLIKIKDFKGLICQDMKKAIKKVNENKNKKVVIDLKDNPGGIIEEASCIASLFVGKVKIVELKYKNKKIPKEVIIGDEDQMFFGEVEVLVNGGSASSAELLAGVLQYYKRAKIVGIRTFGKGTFQQSTSSSWDNLFVDYMKTQGFFFFPNNKSPQLTGVTPDFTFEEKERSYREEEIFLYPLKIDNEDLDSASN